MTLNTVTQREMCSREEEKKNARAQGAFSWGYYEWE